MCHISLRIEYAQVAKMLGNGRLEAQCFDGEKRLAHIRGKLRKKVWINQGDIILLSLREFQDAKADVILKYTADEARNLKAYGELPETAKINETDTFPTDGDEEIAFDFDIEDVCHVPNRNTDDRSNHWLVFLGALVHIVHHSMKIPFRATSCGYREFCVGYQFNTSNCSISIAHDSY